MLFEDDEQKNQAKMVMAAVAFHGLLVQGLTSDTATLEAFNIAEKFIAEAEHRYG